ncbi:4-hydroxy-2-oxovalerate aldolase MhpE [Mycobacterium tuberculosis variant bovis BCG]|nr:4-hydroxy-2-oxovalerate aldolase MhpE [Mycobacterium tuberculosis variant bovis BCG]
MGFGRGAGNCQIECLVAALQRRGHLAAVGLDRIFDAARSDMLGRSPQSYGIDPWEISFGFHGLDSLQVEHLRAAAQQAGFPCPTLFGRPRKVMRGSGCPRKTSIEWSWE